MAWLAAAAPYIGLVTTGVSAYSQVQQGKAAKAGADIAASNRELEAVQQEREANASQAESQRQAINERKRANYMASRALAVSAASGAGASTPTTEKIIGDIQSEGDYRVLSALYSGDTDAELSRYAANVSRSDASTLRRAGSARKRGAYMNAGSTILGGASDFYSKYGKAA